MPFGPNISDEINTLSRRSSSESAIFALDSETSECLHYQPVMGYPPADVASVPRQVLVDHPDVEIRNDFIDCSIDICSVEVLFDSLYFPSQLN